MGTLPLDRGPKIDLSKPPRWTAKCHGRGRHRPSGGSFWDGFAVFAIFDGLGDLLGAIFEGLGSN